MDLPQLRQRIAALDGQIVAMLNARAAYSLDVGAQKRAQLSTADSEQVNVQVYVPGQERAVFERVASLNEGPLPDQAVQAIYREIMSASISLQKDVSVAYLGPRGSFSHEAATQRFGDSVAYVPRDTIDEVFRALETGQVSYGVVPFENSTFGTVLETLDRFRDTATTAHIRAETYLNVRQALLSNYQLSAIKRVYSQQVSRLLNDMGTPLTVHILMDSPQGFGQADAWLQRHLPAVERVNVSSTSRAAELAASETNSAAIAGELCAKLYGLCVVQSDVQSRADNVTRFFVLASESEDRSTGRDKTLIRFSVDHRQPGALCDALRCFKENGINLTSINSRPTLQQPWHYHFFVECTGHRQDTALATTLQQLPLYCPELRVLGSFPDQQPAPSNGTHD